MLVNIGINLYEKEFKIVKNLRITIDCFIKIAYIGTYINNIISKVRFSRKHILILKLIYYFILSNNTLLLTEHFIFIILANNS